MNGSHFDKQTQRERTCSLVHGTWRCVGVRIVSVGACALMVGQLLLPSVALATSARTPAWRRARLPAAPATPTVAEGAAPATMPAATPAPAVAAAPTAQTVAEPQQTTPADVTDESNDAASAEQNAPSGDDAIMPCGVTDVVGGSGVRVNTTVVPHYTDCVLPSNITLEKGQSYTYNFPDVEGGLKEGSYSRISETKYYRADAASGTLAEVQDASMSDVTARFEPDGDHMRLTLTFTGGAGRRLVSTRAQ